MNDTYIQRLLKLLAEWRQNAISDYEDKNDFDAEVWLKKIDEIGLAVFPCKDCGGMGGDCDAGDDGSTISWTCPDCGGSGYVLPKMEIK